MIFVQQNSGEVYLENFQPYDPSSCVSIWFSVLQGNFTISNTIFDQGNYIQILSANSGNISIFDTQITNSVFSKDVLYFSTGTIFVSIMNFKFFNNSLKSSIIHFDKTVNSSITISSLNISTNMPLPADGMLVPYFHYIFISTGQNNTISFQEFLIFNNSTSCNIQIYLNFLII